MKPDEFIHKHVFEQLIKEGFNETTADGGAREAVAHYHRASKAATRQGIFADCLHYAKIFAKFGKRNKTRGTKGQLF